MYDSDSDDYYDDTTDEDEEDYANYNSGEEE